MGRNSQGMDYSLYLVTDSTPPILGDRDLCEVVEASLQGGVTVVQYRDKTSPDEVVLSTAHKLHDITKRHGVPLLINDRVDVALQVGCEGVHIGQDDMEYEQARKMLGPDKIIGVTANSEQEALKATEAGADYLGIGTVYATSTKKDTKSIIGPSGVRDILACLSSSTKPPIPTVCIGGVNADNVSSVLAQSACRHKCLDGVAVVSAIMAAQDPAQASRDLRSKVIRARIPEIVYKVAVTTPLTHNMTNLVVQNFAANVGLAIGASPIMANYAEEAADLAKLGGALVINMGTVTPDGLENFQTALKAYNKAGRPVVLDPVGAGATSVRRNALQTLLSAGHFAVIKGNEGEILTLDSLTASHTTTDSAASNTTTAGPTTLPPSSPTAASATSSNQASQQHGVDSSTVLSTSQSAKLVRDLARRLSNVILLTGKTDILSDGRTTYRVDNGHKMLGMVTGTGCTLGTTVSAMVAAVLPPAQVETPHPTGSHDGRAQEEEQEEQGRGYAAPGNGDVLLAAVAGTVMLEIAAEMAVKREDVKGPGTFVPAFIDELYAIHERTSKRDMAWMDMAKVQLIDLDD